IRFALVGSIQRKRGSAPLGAPQNAATCRPPSTERYIAVPVRYTTSGFRGSAYILPPALASWRVPSVHVSPPSSERYSARAAAPRPPPCPEPVEGTPRPPALATAYSRRPCVPDATANAEMRAPSSSPRPPTSCHVTPPSVYL